MYTDAKRNYDQIIQLNTTNPQLSSLDLKLRIQKDRLEAWGLEWAESNADHTDDIDTSLDRAGIRDLVASIMSSIQKLIDEAENLQPKSRPFPGQFPVDKAGMLLDRSNSSTATDLARLEDVIKDISTSIDTLCDLSKSQQQIIRQDSSASPKKAAAFEKTKPGSASLGKLKISHAQEHVTRDLSTLIASTRIDPTDLIYPNQPEPPAATPPSYNRTATDRGNRVFAFLRKLRRSEKFSSSKGQPSDTPVLVDYYSEDGTNPREGPLPALQRYEDLVLALQGFPPSDEHTYTGSMFILGWFDEPYMSRYAFVYAIPQPPLSRFPMNAPQSLLAYLQNGGDTDVANVPCLEDRFRLALNLVTNILHTHAKGITHRNINSNNVVFAGDGTALGAESKPWKNGVIRTPLIVSWDQCAEDTPNSEPETLISNIYRHPGIEHGQRTLYRPAHDIYSLGLVLLEVGLWMPINKFWKTKYTRADFKHRLQAIYAQKLASKCGRAYMNAVDHCLSVLDVDDRMHHRATSRDRQSRIQNEYYWYVVKPLEKCCMMDSSDEPRVIPASSAPPVRPKSPEVEQQPFAIAGSEPVVEEEPAALPGVPSSPPTLWHTMTAYSPAQPGGKIETSIWTQPVPAESQCYFDTVMMPKLNRMFANAINRWETYEIFVSMVGPSCEMARPTILMVCKSLAKAWKILDYVNGDRKMFDIYVAPGQVKRSKAKKKKKSKKSAKEADKPGQQPSRYQQKPSCGASIGCFVDEQHSEAVTFGGVVVVDNELHGMSVHHMLEDPDSGVDMSGFEGSECSDLPDLDDMFADLSTQIDDDVSNYDNVLGDDGFDMGDFPGKEPGNSENIIVTQPALDDVDPGYFPSEDEMSDDHLVIHGLGTIHASSGLRRTTYDDVAHEVDWALFKMHDDRRPSTNAVDGGAIHCIRAAEEHYPSSVLKSDALGGLNVHAFGSTSGLETGTIAPTMQMTKMPGRVYASPVWRVKGAFGVGGDSGAWVIDNQSGGVCGHVTAYSETMEYATIAPMEVLLHDMEQTLGTSVALPAAARTGDYSFTQQIISTSPALLNQKPRQTSLDSACGSDADTENETEIEPTPVSSQISPGSPVLATSPRPQSSRSMSLRGGSATTVMGVDDGVGREREKEKDSQMMSLNRVAEKWKREKCKEGKGKDGKGNVRATVKASVETRC